MKPNRETVINPSAEQLKSNLMGQGFSPYPLPNVTRPLDGGENSTPLVARLYSLSNNMVKEVRQPQTSILRNHTIQTHQTVDPKRNKSLVPVLRPSKDPNVYLDANGDVRRRKSSQIPLPIDQNTNMAIGNNALGIKREVPGSSIKVEEKQQIYRVIDCLRENYLEKTKYYRMNEEQKEEQDKSQMQMSQNAEAQKNSQGGYFNNQSINIKQFGSQRKGQKELDTYINLLIKNNPNVDQYVYLVRNHESDDPYDLIIKNYFELNGLPKKKQIKPKKGQSSINKKKEEKDGTEKAKDFYTVSLNGIARYINGNPTELVDLSDWIKERETYDKIKQLSFFANFRRWKTLKIWSKNYKNFKQKVAKRNLESKLFITTPEIREAILLSRDSFYNMSQLKFIDFSLIRENQSEICSIIKFVQIQESKAQQTHSLIQQFSREVHQILEDAFEARLEILRNQISHSTENENMKRVGPSTKTTQIFNSIKNPYEAIGFPENMSYDKRSLLRKECHRFVRFAFFIDFLAQETLRGIYLKSLSLLKDEIVDLSQQKIPFIVRDLDKNRNSTLKEPLFSIELKFSLDFNSKDLVQNLQIVSNELEDYKLPQINEDELKPEEYRNYNIVVFPFSVNYDVIDDFNEHQKKYLEYCEPRKYIRQEAVNIEDSVLFFDPSPKEFKTSVFKLFENGLNSLQAFTSFMADKNMRKYFAVLDEWEERDDGRNGDFDSNLLNPEDCIDQEEKRTLEYSIFQIFKDQLIQAKEFLSHFHSFLQIAWEYNKVDYNTLANKNLAKPALTLNAIVNLLEYQKQIFESQIAYQTDIGIFRIQSHDLKKYLLNLPQETNDKIMSQINESLYERIDLCKEWFSENIKRLEFSATDIEIFVLQTQNLRDIEKKVAYYRDMLRVIKEMIEILKKYQIDFKKTYIATFMECKNLENTLVNQIMQISDNLAKNQELFSKDIRDNAIPALVKECTQMVDKLNDAKFLDIKTYNALTDLKSIEPKIISFRDRAKKLNQFEDVLELNRSRFEVLTNLNDVYQTRLLLWESYEEWFKVVENWRKSPFKDINVEEIQTVVEKYQKNISKIRSKIPPKNEILLKVETDVKNFASMLPIVMALRNPKLSKSHYLEIENEINMSLNFDSLVLKDLLNEQVLEHQNQILSISVQVTQEAALKIQLNEIDQKFSELIFPLKPFKEESPKDSTYVLGDIEPLMAEIDRLILMINNVYGSRYLKEYKKLASDKRRDILQLQELLVEWIKFQKNYIYLESIFSQPEIKRPLQLEVKEFEDVVNKVYKQNMKKIMVIQSIALLTKQKYIEQYVITFRKQNEILHELNKKLNNFLDSKRELFPRFYFVSNDELVLILANYDSAAYVQNFIGKLFENVYRADFGSDPRSLSIQGLISREGEVLPLKSVVGIKSDAVERWLKKVEDQMFESLHKTIKEGLKSYSELPRAEWYIKTPSQALSIISQIAWTINVEEVLRSNEKEEEDALEISEVITDSQKNLEILVSLVRKQLSFSTHQSIVATITSEVHNRDILELLAKKNVSNITDFSWQQQLRSYYDDQTDWKSSITIAQITSTQKYGYEYYGPASRIVITPLTERCWITITSALQMKLGAAPAGPAGTGKTESVKDLAKSLARFCVVFNCSDQIDFLTMEKLFRGVIKQGAWTCLDEFNRIDIEVLSVVAQQLLEMRLALLTHQNDDEFFFCGAKCKLNDTCGVFITMNPGYAGRTELPENLKALFRPVAMMIPDYSLISQILLFSEGFIESKILAQKMVKLYKLASEQLSQQKHYDFGMRAVKTVLEMAGRLKRANPDENEYILLIRALKDANIPKFVKDDLPLFNSLLTDLFPGIVVKDERAQDIVDNCIKCLSLKSYQCSDQFIEKIKQLCATIKVRFGTMIVGNALTGKTTLLQTLSTVLNRLSENTPNNHLITLNPKSISMGELFGEENPVTKDWTDGVASFYIRNSIQDESGTSHWICFDGPVDPLWIENMNSVLDDSRLLCLANGQRIRLKTDTRIFFEVDTLEHASPATVSRCGMVLITEEVLGWKSLVKSWIRKISMKKIDDVVIFDDELIAIIESFFTVCFDGLIELFKTFIKPIDQVVFQSVICTLRLMDIYLSEDQGFKPKQDKEYKSKYIQTIFMLAVAWGFGGCVAEESNRHIDLFLRKKFPTFSFPQTPILDCYLNIELVELQSIVDKVGPFEVDGNTSFFEILVPTIDTTKLSNMVELNLIAGNNVFLTGTTGTGKSVVVSNIGKRLANTQKFDNFKYNFSAQTNSLSLQESILNSLFLLSQKSRGARFGRKNIICIDDVNMPAREQFGSQPPVELLRQILDFGCVYDRKEMHQLTIQDTSFICIAAPPEGGRNPLSTRFVRHFSVFVMPRASRDIVFKIFSSILDSFLYDFEDSVKSMSHSIVNASTDFYERICKERLPSPSKFFYTFNLRDLSKTFMGIMQTSKFTTRDPKQFVKLWAHEVHRVFGDRLNSEEDHVWLQQTMSYINGTYLLNKADPATFSSLLFTDIYTMNDEDLYYEEISDEQKLIRYLESALIDYNDINNGKLSLVFFSNAIRHIMRVFRILRQNRGSALLIGVGGLGKMTTSLFASHLATYNVVSVSQARGLTGEKMKEWLRKEVLIKCAGPDAGSDGMPLSLLVYETDVAEEEFFEDINSLLNTGEVPNIFPKDEKEKLEKGLIDMFAEENIVIESSEIWKAFTNRVRDNLHIILCMSPVGDALRIRCRRFPALVDCTAIDWFDNWPGEAIQSVAQKLLEQKDFDNKEEICQLFCEFHQLTTVHSHEFTSQTKRSYYVTPKQTLDNIDLFLELLQKKEFESKESQEVLQKGSKKLEEMGVIVEQLKITLTEAQPLLEEQRKLTEEKLIELEAVSKIANEKREKVEAETSVIQLKTEQIELINNQANSQLAESLPRIQKAENEVRNIDKKELNTLRHLNAPPAMIEVIFSTVCIALDEKYNGWKSTGIKLLSDLPKFVEMLIEKIDRIKTEGSSAISQNSLNGLQRNLKQDYFSDAKLESNIIAKPLGLWCKAIFDFATLKKQIEPLERNAKEMNEKLTEAKKEYELIASELLVCKRNFQQLQEDFNQLENKKKELETNIEQSKIKLERAEKLTTLLADEGVRWKETLADLKTKSECIIGDSFMSSAYISYMGPLTLQFRCKLQECWIQAASVHCKISPNYSFLSTMGNPLQLKDWSANGLPSDEVSQSSALLSVLSKKWPFMIDPQLQANTWIKNTFTENFVVLTSENDKRKLYEKIKIAVVNGMTLLFEDLGSSFESLLDPLIS